MIANFLQLCFRVHHERALDEMHASMHFPQRMMNLLLVVEQRRVARREWRRDVPYVFGQFEILQLLSNPSERTKHLAYGKLLDLFVCVYLFHITDRSYDCRILFGVVQRLDSLHHCSDVLQQVLLQLIQALSVFSAQRCSSRFTWRRCRRRRRI
jgi:hypothetical protein